MSLITSRYLFLAGVLFPAIIATVYFAYAPLSTSYDVALVWIYAQQKIFHDLMTSSLSNLADQTGMSSAMTLIWGSFLYGIFHAAGPGHGKVILSTYLVTHPKNVGKSVGLAAASAIMQGCMAVFLVYGLFYIFDLVPRDSRFAVLWSERLSYLLVIGLGAWLLWRGVSALRKWREGFSKRLSGHSHKHGGHDHAAHDHSDHNHNHHHGHDLVHCDSCGHSHVPNEHDLDKINDWRSVLGVVVSIGLRPCSGAVLVLIFARFAGVAWAGVASVFAISVGTAITVSLIALLAVQMREFSKRLFSHSDSALASFSGVVMACGGLVLIVFGYGLFLGTYAGPIRSMGLG